MNPMNENMISLVKKYDRPGPRYTSYPTAVEFSDRFGPDDFVRALEKSNQDSPPRPLSLYVHVPFCESVCFFCGCNTIFTVRRERAETYLDDLEKELDLVASHVDSKRQVAQLHWGGGTPTFLPPEACDRLCRMLKDRFTFRPDAEISVEVDPRETSRQHLEVLRSHGFNRLSMGVQDFNLKVQEAIHRVQSHDLTARTISDARELGYASINVDLIYGLPLQTETSFRDTVEKIIALNPDRIAVFNFAYLPHLIKHQKAINETDLPDPDEKLRILAMVNGLLDEAGYRYIGMDHFAKPEDDLCKAQDDGTLYRNFQGYSTHSGCDLIGFGVSAISQIGPTYSQNHKDLVSYLEALKKGQIPTARGVALSREDELRRDVITRLICHLRLDKKSINQRWDIDFDDYFADALSSLEPMAADDLIRLGSDQLEITSAGQMLIRNLCMPFDAYLQGKSSKSFSRTV